MKMWEAGAPIEGGNDTGIPDVKYFSYLRGHGMMTSTIHAIPVKPMMIPMKKGI